MTRVKTRTHKDNDDDARVPYESYAGMTYEETLADLRDFGLIGIHTFRTDGKGHIPIFTTTLEAADHR